MGVLSPAICPDCPSSGNSDDTLTQEQLYERMDIVCSKNITDMSGFTFFEIVQRHNGNNIGERYLEALAYFRTGKKGLIRADSDPAAAAAADTSIGTSAGTSTRMLRQQPQPQPQLQYALLNDTTLLYGTTGATRRLLGSAATLEAVGTSDALAYFTS